MVKDIHFFNLDESLLDTGTQLCVIDKRNPAHVLLKLPLDRVELLQNHWKRHQLPISYNGASYFLSPEILSQIEAMAPGIKLTDIGISKREIVSAADLENNLHRVQFMLDNVKHIKARDSHIAILAQRGRSADILLDRLESSLRSALSMSIRKVYYVNELDELRRRNILLEHLTGYKVRDERFIGVSQSLYKDVYYYDVDERHIEGIKGIQGVYIDYLSNTEKPLAKKIDKAVNTGGYALHTNLITNNTANPFVSETVRLKAHGL
jgi:hypothetical protein